MTSRSFACTPITGTEWADALDTDAREIVARNLRLLMGKQKLIPAELARRLGLNRSTVSAWLSAESGPEYKLLIPLAALLKCQVADFFVAENEAAPPPRPPTDRVEKAVRAFVEALEYEGTVRIKPKNR